MAVTTKAKRGTDPIYQEPKEKLLDYLRTMYEIRFFEEKVYELVRSRQIKGASHLYAGQEAVAVGAVASITRNDMITSTHRGHGHCGAIGNLWCDSEQDRQMHWNKMLAELMGRETGYCRGRGGSMHIADVEKGNLGATGIVGGNIPIAVGAALAESFKQSGAVVLCFFGDGAVNTGSFHESLNLAAVTHGGLPVVFICENNLYAMSMPWHDRSVPEAPYASRVRDVVKRAEAYGIPGFQCNGMDVLDVKEKVSQAVQMCREGKGPVLVEARTYRYFGHSLSDQQRYRTKEELEEYRQRDPILLLRHRMLEAGIATEAEMDAVMEQARQTIDEAERFAKASPLPPAVELFDDLYVPKDPIEFAREREQEEALRARIRPIENEIRRIAREQAGTPGGAILPKLKKEDAQRLEEKYGIPIKYYNEALAQAHAEEMRRDWRVFVMGEDVGLYGGAYAATRGLWDEFGGRRVIDTPISELAIAGAGAGAAMRGMRPIVEFQYVDFTTLGSDQILHNAAYNRYMFGGKTKVPVVYRSQGGVGRCIAAHHSESLEGWWLHVPGLYLVMPSTPYDAKGLLKAAVRDDNPIMFLEHKLLYSGVMGPVPDEDYVIPLGVADIKKPGEDVTIVAYSRMVHVALDAAWDLEEQEGIRCEVIDPRTLHPLDVATIANSVRKTGRVILMSEGWTKGGVANEFLRQILEYRFENGYSGWDYLDMQPVILAAKDVPVPMSEPLEDASIPTREDVIAAVHLLCQ